MLTLLILLWVFTLLRLFIKVVRFKNFFLTMSQGTAFRSLRQLLLECDGQESTLPSPLQSADTNTSKYGVNEYPKIGKRDTYYLNPTLKGLNHRINIEPTNVQQGVQRFRASKYETYRIALMLRAWKGTIAEFVKLYRKQNSQSPKGQISRIAVSTLYEWSLKYRGNSMAWETLKKYIEERPALHSIRKKTFRLDPFEVKFGFFPVIEAYLMHLRCLKAASFENRTIDWLVSAAEQLRGNDELMQLLRRLMQQNEIDHLQRWKVSNGWTRRVMVWIIYILRFYPYTAPLIVQY